MVVSIHKIGWFRVHPVIIGEPNVILAAPITNWTPTHLQIGIALHQSTKFAASWRELQHLRRRPRQLTAEFRKKKPANNVKGGVNQHSREF